VVRIFLFFIIFPAHLLASSNSADFYPFETREQNLFNLIHGQALPTNASLNKESQGSWTSSLAITNTLNIESNSNEDIYLDYEAYRFNLSYQYGFNHHWNLKVDVPLIYQGAGVLDSTIDSWHKFFGFPRGHRPYVENNHYDIQYTYQSQSLLNLDESSTSLGDIQIAIARSIMEDTNTTISLWTGLKLPTGDEARLTSSGAADISAWLALNRQLTNSWVINMNAGAVVLGGSNYRNIPLSEYALYGHLMLGWLASDDISLKMQLQGHTSYYDQSQLKILGDTYFLILGGTITFDRCNQLDIAMSEDINVDASPDASLLISWRQISSCSKH